MAEETEIKKVKRIVFTSNSTDGQLEIGDDSPFVVEYENGSIGIFSMQWETTRTLRDFADGDAAISFEYDWTLEKFTNTIKKEVGEDVIGIVSNDSWGDAVCVYLASPSGRAICGKTWEGDSVKQGLRKIAESEDIEYDENWNTQQLGKNLISALIKKQEEEYGKKIEPKERVVIPTNIGKKSLAENENFENYVNGLLSALEKIKKDQQYTLRELFYIESLANRSTKESLELFDYAEFDLEDTPEDLRLEITDALYVNSFESVQDRWERAEAAVNLDTYNFHIEYDGFYVKAYKLEEEDF